MPGVGSAQGEEASVSGRGNPLDAPLGGGRARFSAVVLDSEGIAAEGALRECCVFVVPQVGACACAVIYEGFDIFDAGQQHANNVNEDSGKSLVYVCALRHGIGDHLLF